MSQEKVALISGTGGTIDSALAKALLEAGYLVEHVGQQGALSPSLLNELSVRAVDLTDENKIQIAVQSVLEKRQRIDCLVNSPDLRHHRALTELTEKLWDESMAINLTSIFLMCKHALPIMMKQKSGKIVNVVSDAARIGAYMGAAYSSAKGAVIGFSKSLSREMASYGITVNMISVGYIGEGIVPFRQDSEGNAIPLGRVGQWEEVATICLCLLDEKVSYMTGQTIHVNGGLLMP